MTKHLVKVVRRTCEGVSRYYAHRLRDWQDVERVGKLSEDLQLARKLLRQIEAHTCTTNSSVARRATLVGWETLEFHRHAELMDGTDLRSATILRRCMNS